VPERVVRPQPPTRLLRPERRAGRPEPEELRAVDANLRSPGADRLDVVNLYRGDVGAEVDGASGG